MGELKDWLGAQHPGLRTFRTFSERASELGSHDDQHRALYRLLSNIAAHYEATFDEEPLPVNVADRAYRTFVGLVELGDDSLDKPPEQQLAALNTIASAKLF